MGDRCRMRITQWEEPVIGPQGDLVLLYTSGSGKIGMLAVDAGTLAQRGDTFIHPAAPGVPHITSMDSVYGHPVNWGGNDGSVHIPHTNYFGPDGPVLRLNARNANTLLPDYTIPQTFEANYGCESENYRFGFWYSGGTSYCMRINKNDLSVQQFTIPNGFSSGFYHFSNAFHPAAALPNDEVLMLAQGYSVTSDWFWVRYDKDFNYLGCYYLNGAFPPNVGSPTSSYGWAFTTQLNFAACASWQGDQRVWFGTLANLNASPIGAVPIPTATLKTRTEWGAPDTQCNHVAADGTNFYFPVSNDPGRKLIKTDGAGNVLLSRNYNLQALIAAGTSEMYEAQIFRMWS